MKIRPDRRVTNLLDESADRGIQWRVVCCVQFLIRGPGDVERIRLAYSRVQIKNTCVVGVRRINIIIESSGAGSKKNLWTGTPENTSGIVANTIMNAIAFWEWSYSFLAPRPPAYISQCSYKLREVKYEVQQSFVSRVELERWEPGHPFKSEKHRWECIWLRLNFRFHCVSRNLFFNFNCTGSAKSIF